MRGLGGRGGGRRTRGREHRQLMPPSPEKRLSHAQEVRPRGRWRGVWRWRQPPGLTQSESFHSLLVMGPPPFVFTVAQRVFQSRGFVNDWTCVLLSLACAAVAAVENCRVCAPSLQRTEMYSGFRCSTAAVLPPRRSHAWPSVPPPLSIVLQERLVARRSGRSRCVRGGPEEAMTDCRGP